MKIRCKYRLTDRSTHTYMGAKQGPDGRWVQAPATTHTLKFTAVTGGLGASPENQSFWEATPSGDLMIGCASGALADKIAEQMGGEFYIDVEPCNKTL